MLKNIKNIKNNLDNINNYIDILIGLWKLFKKIYPIIIPIFSVLFGLSKFEDIRLYLSKFLPESFIEFISKISEGVLGIILVILIIILVFTIRRTGKKVIEVNDTVYNLIYQLHNKFIHQLRDGICELYSIDEKIKEYKKDNKSDALYELQNHAIDNLKYNLQSFVDLISSYLSEINDDTISVCIKTINPKQEEIKDADKKAKTLVRSNNTNRRRKRKNEDITIGKNSDFIHLCNSTNVCFCGIDLKTMYNNGEYFTEIDTRDWQNKYNSTIVVPIRYNNTNENKICFDILGFLCIDSKNIVDKWTMDDKDPLELHYLAIFADLIYTYIKSFRNILEKI